MNKQDLKRKIKKTLISPIKLIQWTGTSVNQFFEDNPFSFTRLLLLVYTAMIGFVIWFIYSVVTDIVEKITVVDENAASIVGSVTLLLGAVLGGLTVLAGLYQKIKGVVEPEKDDEVEEEDIHDRYE